jgi:hypothetical protein
LIIVGSKASEKEKRARKSAFNGGIGGRARFIEAAGALPMHRCKIIERNVEKQSIVLF